MIRSHLLDRDRILSIGSISIVGDLHYETGCQKHCTDRLLQNLPNETTTVVLNGDVANSFPPTDTVIELLEKLYSQYESVIYIEGNHERMVGGIRSWLPDPVQYTQFAQFTHNEINFTVTHGHDLFIDMDLSDTHHIIINHIHPAYKSYPCAIQNDFQFKTQVDTTVTVLPAYGNGISSSYENHSGKNDYIDVIPESHCIKYWK